MRLILFVWIAVASLLAGCATPTTPIPNVELKRGDRVGILVEAGDTLMHMHVGTTVFNNFSTPYPYNMGLSARVYQTVDNAVQSAGLQPVSLSDAGIHSADLVGLIELSDTQWQIGKGKEATLKRLQDKLNLKAVLTLKSAQVLALTECSGGPCSFRYMTAPGLFTRSFFGPTRYYAVAAYRWNLYVLDPVVDLARVQPLLEKVDVPAMQMAQFKEPADLKKLTADELGPVRDDILRLVREASSTAIQALKVK